MLKILIILFSNKLNTDSRIYSKKIHTDKTNIIILENKKKNQIIINMELAIY